LSYKKFAMQHSQLFIAAFAVTLSIRDAVFHREQ